MGNVHENIKSAKTKDGGISKILICDDHPISRLGVKCALKEIFPENKFSFVEATLGKEALSIIKNQQVDLLVLDFRLPDISGLDVLKTLRGKSSFNGKIMILTGEESVHVLLQLLRYNTDAILLKSYTLSMLESAIKHIERNESGHTYLDPSLKTQLQAEADKQLLSPREFEILELLLKGHTNKTIATLLNCSPATVKNHRTSIREKTNLKNRDEMLTSFQRGIEKDI